MIILQVDEYTNRYDIPGRGTIFVVPAQHRLAVGQLVCINDWIYEVTGMESFGCLCGGCHSETVGLLVKKIRSREEDMRLHPF
jgi:hypothetical protein